MKWNVRKKINELLEIPAKHLVQFFLEQELISA